MAQVCVRERENRQTSSKCSAIERVRSRERGHNALLMHYNDDHLHHRFHLCWSNASLFSSPFPSWSIQLANNRTEPERKSARKREEIERLGRGSNNNYSNSDWYEGERDVRASIRELRVQFEYTHHSIQPAHRLLTIEQKRGDRSSHPLCVCDSQPRQLAEPPQSLSVPPSENYWAREEIKWKCTHTLRQSFSSRLSPIDLQLAEVVFSGENIKDWKRQHTLQKKTHTGNRSVLAVMTAEHEAQTAFRREVSAQLHGKSLSRAASPALVANNSKSKPAKVGKGTGMEKERKGSSVCSIRRLIITGDWEHQKRVVVVCVIEKSVRQTFAGWMLLLPTTSSSSNEINTESSVKGVGKRTAQSRSQSLPLAPL